MTLKMLKHHYSNRKAKLWQGGFSGGVRKNYGQPIHSVHKGMLIQTVIKFHANQVISKKVKNNGRV